MIFPHRATVRLETRLSTNFSTFLNLNTSHKSLHRPRRWQDVVFMLLSFGLSKPGSGTRHREPRQGGQGEALANLPCSPKSTRGLLSACSRLGSCRYTWRENSRHHPDPFECAASASLLSDKIGFLEGILVLEVVSSLDGISGQCPGGQH
jgi:hypothetical protein